MKRYILAVLAMVCVGSVSPSWGSDPPAKKKSLCPEGSVCAEVASFTKTDIGPEVREFQISPLTAEGGFYRVVLHQRIAGEKGVIVNRIQLRHRGRWVSYKEGSRLGEGRTEFLIAVPRYSDTLALSLDDGKSATVNVMLERSAADR